MEVPWRKQLMSYSVLYWVVLACCMHCCAGKARAGLYLLSSSLSESRSGCFGALEMEVRMAHDIRVSV